MKEYSSSPGLHSAPLGPPTGVGKGEPRKRDPTKAKQRKNHSKDHQQQDPSDSANPGISDPAKKTRRKKSKDSNASGGPTRPRTKANAYADPGPDGESLIKQSDLDPISNT